MEANRNKKLSAAALALLLPAPSIGVVFGMILLPGEMLGQILFFISKLWILALPLVWLLLIDKKPLSISKPDNGGFVVATVLGLLMAGSIVLAYILCSRWLIDSQAVKDMAASNGLDKKFAYIAGSVYWVCINSVLEEYVWRWFVVEKFSNIFKPRTAMAASALGFTAHHILAMQLYFNWTVTIAAAVGIFIGGTVWSWCYLRYRSIWPGYISHAIVDIAVFGIGWHLIFC